MKSLSKLTTLALCVTAPLSASAVLVIEDFHYPDLANATTLVGASGGQGWNGSWQGAAGVLFNSTLNMVYAGYPLVQTEGSGSLYSSTVNYRGIYRNLESSASGEIWFSYVFRQGGSVGAGGLLFNATEANTVAGSNNPTAWNVQLAPGGTLNVTLNGAVTAVATGLVNAVDYLVLGRMVTGADGEFDLWLSPDLTGISSLAGFTAAPNFSATGVLNPDSIGSLGVTAYYSGGSGSRVFRFDALRLSDGAGDTAKAFQDVTGVQAAIGGTMIVAVVLQDGILGIRFTGSAAGYELLGNDDLSTPPASWTLLTDGVDLVDLGEGGWRYDVDLAAAGKTFFVIRDVEAP